jgi:hypothetical protein
LQGNREGRVRQGSLFTIRTVTAPPGPALALVLAKVVPETVSLAVWEIEEKKNAPPPLALLLEVSANAQAEIEKTPPVSILESMLSAAPTAEILVKHWRVII